MHFIQLSIIFYGGLLLIIRSNLNWMKRIVSVNILNGEGNEGNVTELEKLAIESEKVDSSKMGLENISKEEVTQSVGLLEMCLGLFEPPGGWRVTFLAIYPLCMFSGSIWKYVGLAFAGISCTYNICLILIPVSFLNTIKSSVPIFTVLICRFYYQLHFPQSTYFSLVPIVMGVGMASYGELSFNMIGFLFAVTSSFCSTLFNLFTKKLMGTSPMDNYQIQFYVSLCTFFFIVPIWIAFNVLNSQDSNINETVELIADAASEAPSHYGALADEVSAVEQFLYLFAAGFF